MQEQPRRATLGALEVSGGWEELPSPRSGGGQRYTHVRGQGAADGRSWPLAN